MYSISTLYIPMRSRWKITHLYPLDVYVSLNHRKDKPALAGDDTCRHICIQNGSLRFPENEYSGAV